MTSPTSAITEAAPPSKPAPRQYRYYEFVMVSFVVLLLCSNLIGPAKIASLFGVTFGAGILFFPLSYVFGDILTEVYGYARSRRVVWAGFGAIVFSAVMSAVVVNLPPAPGWEGQAAVQAIFGNTWRVVLASLMAYSCGEFTNSFVLAKMKILTRGRHLWMRTIGSTMAGELVDSLVFYPVAFLGLWETDLVIKVMITNYLLKCAWEALMTPVTYKLVAFLKEQEHEDHYDTNTDFSPFNLGL
jgi:uncharacterized integral membrane protein (TIGR00697 family)